jgi:hypothetical protein
MDSATGDQTMTDSSIPDSTPSSQPMDYSEEEPVAENSIAPAEGQKEDPWKATDVSDNDAAKRADKVAAPEAEQDWYAAERAAKKAEEKAKYATEEAAERAAAEAAEKAWSAANRAADKAAEMPMPTPPPHPTPNHFPEGENTYHNNGERRYRGKGKEGSDDDTSSSSDSHYKRESTYPQPQEDE